MPQAIKELRDKQAKLLADARARLDEITAETPEGRAKELEAQHDAAMAEFDTIEERAARLEKLDAADAAAEERAARLRADRRPNAEDVDERRDGVQVDERKVFEKLVRFGVEALDENERRAAQAFSRIRDPELRAQTITTTGGGYLIPQGYQPEIIKTMADWGPMTDETVIRVLRTASGNPLPIPTVDDTGNTGVDHTINSADADQDVTFGQKQLDAYVAGSGMVKVPFELLQDSVFDMGPLLNELFGERLGRRLNTKLTTGTGSSQANGIVTASSLGKTAASATAIAADELFDLVHAVNPAYRKSPKCAWQFNDLTFKAIRKLKDGQSNYLWQMGDVRTGAPSLLLDKPYHVNQAMADIATGAKTVIFGDMSKYWTRIVAEFVMLTLRERFADAFQVGFTAFARYDGELVDTAAVKHLIQA
jgi:HK97 family phage major capsid protein